MAYYAIGLTVWIALQGIPADPLILFLWLWLASVAWNISSPLSRHLAFLRDWTVPILVLVVYTYTRGLADGLGFPTHRTLPIVVDEWLGGGHLPTEVLQDALCGSTCGVPGGQWYDTVFTATYVSHFFVALVIAVVLWLRNRSVWLSWMRRLLPLYLAGLVVYVVYPMAPPWMAERDGDLQLEIVRQTGRGWSGIGSHLAYVLNGPIGNDVAAMPSLHAGTAFLIAFFAIQRARRRYWAPLIAYPLVMSVALVYFGEHYVIDIVAGAALAYAVHRIACVYEARRPPTVDPLEDQHAGTAWSS
jgi:hypothetical protein